MKPKNKDINDNVNILAEMSRDCHDIADDKMKQALSLESILSQVGQESVRHLCTVPNVFPIVSWTLTSILS